MDTGALEFRPAAPHPRGWVCVAFLALIFAILSARILARPPSGSLLELTGLVLFVASGTWLLLRLRFPGAPRLFVDRGGMTYRRRSREQGLAWEQVAAIEVHHLRKELHFVPVSGRGRIIMHRDMVTDDGTRFDTLIERYWRAPTKRVRD
jgi:hypothetical protein